MATILWAVIGDPDISEVALNRTPGKLHNVHLVKENEHVTLCDIKLPDEQGYFQEYQIDVTCPTCIEKKKALLLQEQKAKDVKKGTEKDV